MGYDDLGKFAIINNDINVILTCCLSTFKVYEDEVKRAKKAKKEKKKKHKKNKKHKKGKAGSYVSKATDNNRWLTLLSFRSLLCPALTVYPVKCSGKLLMLMHIRNTIEPLHYDIVRHKR